MKGEDNQQLPRVDQSAIKVSQASMILVLLIGFILDLWPLIAAVAVINFLGVIDPSLNLWRQLYLRVLKPAGWVKPSVIPDHHEPHLFAKAVGGVLATVASVLLALDLPIAGWVVTWILIFLAALNLFLGFCLGCFTYYQLNRLGVPGFGQSPIEEAT
ncbi:MAG: DUF4395 domain-containing protein [Anaerolineae bacterium]